MPKDNNNSRQLQLKDCLRKFALRCDQRGRAILIREGFSEPVVLSNNSFDEFISKQVFEKHRYIPTRKTIDGLRNVLIAQARAKKNEPVHIFSRVGYFDSAIYYDLANDKNEVVRITASGIDIVDQPPIYFHRPAGIHPQKPPDLTSDDSLATLLQNLYPQFEDSVTAILCSFLACTLKPHGPKPILVIEGAQGSRKSTLTAQLKRIVDPRAALSRSLPYDERNLLISANNIYLVAFDNVSKINSNVADMLCRLVTGAGFNIRKNYSDDEEVLIDVRRPIIINSINNPIERDDLRDRSLVARLPKVSSSDRKTEAEANALFESLLPRFLGALFQCVRTALARYEQVTRTDLGRMADAELWIRAAEPAMGIPATELQKALQSQRQASVMDVLDSSPVFPLLLTLLRSETKQPRTISRSAADLLDVLRCNMDRVPGSLMPVDFPKNPQQLSRHINEISDALRRVGIQVNMSRGRDGRSIQLTEVNPFDDGGDGF